MHSQGRTDIRKLHPKKGCQQCLHVLPTQSELPRDPHSSSRHLAGYGRLVGNTSISAAQYGYVHQKGRF